MDLASPARDGAPPSGLLFFYAVPSALAGFLFLAFMMFLHLLWAVCLVPETKGVALEEIQRRLGLLGA